MTDISIVIYTFNEEDNVNKVYLCIKKIMSQLKIDWNLTFIDNNSEDNTQAQIKKICSNDKQVRAIINTSNFGQFRSPFYGLINSNSKATILLPADFQIPYEIISELINDWKVNKSKIILAKRISSQGSFLLKFYKSIYYYLMSKIDSNHISYTTGDGLYDFSVIDILKKINDPEPYLRGIVTELGIPIKLINYKQETRKLGQSKNNFLTLFGMSLKVLIKYSLNFLKIIKVVSIFSGLFSLFIALFFLIYKILFWDSFSLGMAPLIVGFFGFSSIVLFLLSTIGEQLGYLNIQKKNLPIVIEKERINFD